MTLPIAIVISALAGFISLSYEIVWFRAFSFASGGTADTFGLLLGAFLLGLALGGRIAQKTLHAQAGPGERRNLGELAARMLAANILAFLVIPSLAASARFAHDVLALEAVGLAAVGWGATLPLLSQFAIEPDGRAGQGLSYIYVANISGSVIGTILTGFVLLDLLSLRAVAVALAIGGLGLSVWLIYLSHASGLQRRVMMFVAALFALGIGGTPILFDRVYEKLLVQGSIAPLERFANVVENRNGVITVTRDGDVFGSGAYDGGISIDLVSDVNRIVRAYAIAALHPNPREVLMIGLSTGAWAQVLAHMPGVDNITVVEINPGYLRLIAKYPTVSSLLTNPKVHIIVDDGRRWLARNPQRRFDVIVMNTTYHWRAHITNLLSQEFVQLARAHLRGGGIFYYNTTGSDDALKTGLTIFPYGRRFLNFVALSDAPIDWDSERFRFVLENYSIDGRKVLDLSRVRDRSALEKLAAIGDEPDSGGWNGIESRQHALDGLARASIVTDDNMIPEWKTALINRIIAATGW